MKRTSLYFQSPGKVSVREEPLPTPGSGELIVETELSAISQGTEMAVLRGHFPEGALADTAIPALARTLRFPMKYGYSAVGRVVAAGGGVDEGWIGRRVFGFNPHESHFIGSLEGLLPLPEGMPWEDAVLLAGTETALSLVMDGRPVIGEKVAVLGQGVIGLLTTALLARFPLACLLSLDSYPLRRRASLEFGAQASYDPQDGFGSARGLLGELGADLCFELSGTPAALSQAIALSGFSGRIIAGSWYGERAAELGLGTHFHRSRIRIISSQVSTIEPTLTGRWSHRRRFELAWRMLGEIKPSRLITHRFPITRAAEAYRLLEEAPGEAIQMIFTYR